MAQHRQTVSLLAALGETMDAALDLMWSKYRGWSARARTIRSDLDRWRLRTLALTVIGAVLATLASQLPGRLPNLQVVAQFLSAASAVAMALAAWAASSMLDSKVEKDWIRARALAERAKSEAYRYATRVPPYDGADASQKLFDKVKELMAEGEDLPAIEPEGADASKGRPGSPLSVQDYIAIRLEEQINWFAPKATMNERNAARCTRAVQVLSAIAAGLGALGAVFAGAGIEVWVATLSTITTAIGTYALAERYQRLAATYRLAADRLKLRLTEWQILTQGQPANAAADHALILDSEGLMNGENDAWVADFLKRTATPAGANAVP
ncbi:MULTISPECIES: DUF4231 domain-containing protein [unclassified Caballeronia]|uniref:DUF4231 domain-containing protein n=1 Tax=unclassified Caballeronia TaxID=2646786 RepID=UPI00285B174A|nr:MULTISPECIES: DUF4231 domain-containing protein [unclassified Caballeronia]MDR5752847.1 DUF4231 domain-containing protein [Caballeronia sp. LZ024]MDR5841491.1 DUF4231 domain-containing protein [Caballeronia sp. LZ031]